MCVYDRQRINKKQNLQTKNKTCKQATTGKWWHLCTHKHTGHMWEDHAVCLSVRVV